MLDSNDPHLALIWLCARFKNVEVYEAPTPAVLRLKEQRSIKLMQNKKRAHTRTNYTI